MDLLSQTIITNQFYNCVTIDIIGTSPDLHQLA